MSRGRRGVHKDAQPLVQAALDAGWTLDNTGTGHPRLKPPSGGKPIVMSMTPKSVGLMVRLLRRDLRREGVNV